MSTVVKNHVISTLNEDITSPFGMRVHPTTGLNEFHYGIDIVDKAGLQHTSPVGILAIADGEVVAITSSAERGFYVDILHADSIMTRYQHLAYQSISVAIGDIVAKGQEIAKMGNTGIGTGKHLHFETIVNCVLGTDGKYAGTVVDPMPYLTEEGKIYSMSNTPNVLGEKTVIVSTSDGMPVDGIYMTDKASYPLHGNNCNVTLNSDIGIPHTVSFGPKQGYTKPDDFGYLTSSTPQQFNKVYEKGNGNALWYDLPTLDELNTLLRVKYPDAPYMNYYFAYNKLTYFASFILSDKPLNAGNVDSVQFVNVSEVGANRSKRVDGTMYQLMCRIGATAPRKLSYSSASKWSAGTSSSRHSFDYSPWEVRIEDTNRFYYLDGEMTINE